MKIMMLTQLGRTVTGLLVLTAVALGGGLLTFRTAAGQQADGDGPTARRSAPLGRDGGTVAKRGAAETDLDRLQGVWSVVTIEQGGKPARPGKAVFMVDGKRACWQGGGSEMQGGLYLDPAGEPKTYDLATSTKTVEGIYSLEGDTLRLCYDTATEPKRPGGFITGNGTGQVLVVLKRSHGPGAFPYRLADGSSAFPSVVERARRATPPPRVAPTPEDGDKDDLGPTKRAEPPKEPQDERGQPPGGSHDRNGKKLRMDAVVPPADEVRGKGGALVPPRAHEPARGGRKDDFTPRSKAGAGRSSDRPDREAIQGEWRVLYSECKGEDITQKMWEGQSLGFDKDVAYLKIKGDERRQGPARFTLGSVGQRKTIELSGGPVPNTKGTYTLEGDVLVLSMLLDPLDGQGGRTTTIVVLKRSK